MNSACGGPWGYEDVRAIIKDPRHKEYLAPMDDVKDEYPAIAAAMEGVTTFEREASKQY